MENANPVNDKPGLMHVESFHVEVGDSHSDGGETACSNSTSQLGTNAQGESSHTHLISLAGGEGEAVDGSHATAGHRDTAATHHMEHGVEREMQEFQHYIDDDPKKEINCCQKYFTLQTWLRILVVAVYLALVLVLVLVVKVQDRISELERFGQENRALGGFLIILLYASTVLFYLPGAVLTILTAGLLFDFWLATFLIWSSAVASQTIAFLLGRYVLQKPVLRMASKYRLWKALEDAITENGFLVTMLCRAPGMPYNTINYVMGVTEVKFWVYSLASAIGVAPKIALFIYFGETLGDAVKILSGAKEDVTMEDYIRVGLSMGLALLAFVLVIVIMQWALRRKLREMKRAEEEQEQEEAASKAATSVSNDETESNGELELPVTRLEGGHDAAALSLPHLRRSSCDTNSAAQCVV